MFKKISLALLVGVGAVVTGVFEAPANAKSYKSVSAYCNAEHSSAVEDCKKKVSEHRNKFPVPNAPKDNSQGTNRKSPQSERVGTDATSSSQQTPQSVSDEKNKSVSLPQTGQTTSESSTSSAAQKIEGVLPGIQRSQSQGETNQQNKPSEPGEQAQSSSQSEKSEPVGSEPSGSDQTSTRSPLPQQQTGSPNGTELSEPKSSEDFGVLAGNQSAGDPIKSEGSSSDNQEAISETEKPKSAETQTEKEQTQEQTNALSKSQLSEKKVEAFCGKQNVMAGTGSKEVYNRCITQVEKHPDEFPQLHKSETTKPSADSEDEASASDASSASEEKNANESEKQEQIENKEEREREDRDKDGKVQTETSVDQPTPNEGENAEKGNNDPPQKKPIKNPRNLPLDKKLPHPAEFPGWEKLSTEEKMAEIEAYKRLKIQRAIARGQKKKAALKRKFLRKQNNLHNSFVHQTWTYDVSFAANHSGIRGRALIYGQNIWNTPGLTHETEVQVNDNQDSTVQGSSKIMYNLTKEDKDFNLRVGGGVDYESDREQNVGVGPRVSAGLKVFDNLPPIRVEAGYNVGGDTEVQVGIGRITF